MNILIVDDRIPDPHFGAGFPRAYRFLLSLRQLGHNIFFFPMLKETIKDINIEELKNYGIEIWLDLEEHKNQNLDIAIMSRPHNMHYHYPTVKKVFPDIKVVYDTEALWFRRYDLQLSITGKLPGWAYRYDEIGFAQKVDLCFVVNDIEKKILEENNVKKVVKLAHALDLNENGLSFEERKNILVVGGKLEEDSTNEDALWWYLENCWNQVLDTLNCNLDATGSVCTDRLKNNSFGKLNLMGHVGDLIELYESHRVFVASTRFSTGIPWKVHEAMANGIPCVISRLLATQLKLEDDVEAMVCDTPQDFIDKTIKLYSNKEIWTKMRQAAFDYVKIDCNVENFKNIIQTNLLILNF